MKRTATIILLATIGIAAVFIGQFLARFHFHKISETVSHHLVDVVDYSVFWDTRTKADVVQMERLRFCEKSDFGASAPSVEHLTCRVGIFRSALTQEKYCWSRWLRLAPCAAMAVYAEVFETPYVKKRVERALREPCRVYADKEKNKGEEAFVRILSCNNGKHEKKYHFALILLNRSKTPTGLSAVENIVWFETGEDRD